MVELPEVSDVGPFLNFGLAFALGMLLMELLDGFFILTTLQCEFTRLQTRSTNAKGVVDLDDHLDTIVSSSSPSKAGAGFVDAVPSGSGSDSFCP